MTYIVVSIIIALICLGAIGYGIVDGEVLWAAGGVVAAIVFLGGGFLLASYQQVGSGQLGLVYGISGVLQSEIGPGTHTVPPWESVTDVNTKTQSAQFTHLTAFSRESQDIFGDIQINYHIDSRDVVPLYRSVGPNWYDTFIPGAVNQDFKEQTVKYYTTQIAPHRAQIASDLLAALQSDLGAHSIKVDNVFVKNIDYSPQFRAAIEQKQAAQQKAAQAGFQADAVRAVARGDRDATKIRADGQAAANRALASSLNDRIIRYQLVQKLAPNIRVLLPTNGFFNLGGIR